MPLEHPEHPIVRIKGSLVYFDTGSARSLIPDPNAAWLGVLGIVAQQMTGIPRLVFQQARITLARLTGGVVIDALIGMDLISEHGLAYDLLAGGIGWGLSQQQTRQLTPLSSELVLGLPVIEMELAGRQMRAILDTGCHTDGYVLDLPKMLPEAGIIRDESPMFGPFESAARYSEASVLAKNGSKINLEWGRYAEAPPPLEFTLSATGVDGVVGVVMVRQAKSTSFAGSMVCVH